mgnify:CR=1 FL=1
MKLVKAKALASLGVKPYKLNRSLQKLGFKLYDIRANKGKTKPARKKSTKKPN